MRSVRISIALACRRRGETDDDPARDARYARRDAQGRGQRYSLEYSDAWLAGGFELGPDVPLSRGRQFSRKAFGFIEDASPDRWGRTLILRHSRAQAKKTNQAPRALTTLDYFVGVSDASRQGALRARRGDDYLAPGAGPPPLVHLGALLRASNDYQAGAYDDETLALLLAPGSSLGGARPKASVRDAQGDLFVAKFPKSDDAYSVERWEFVAQELARRAGCRVVEAQLLNVNEQPVLLSRRFDRDRAERIHFSSAMNLLELTDGDASSYAEIADLMQRVGGDPVELFRRMVVNILINNVDDHLRNHGFLRVGPGWELSPAYDINPISRFEKAPRLSTAIVPGEFEASTDIAIDNAELFNLTKRAAQAICEQAAEAVGTWRSVARDAEAPRHEVDEIESAFAK